MDKEFWWESGVWIFLFLWWRIFPMRNLYRRFENSIGYLLGIFCRSNWRIWNNKFRGWGIDISACFTLSLSWGRLLYWWYNLGNRVRRRSLNTILMQLRPSIWSNCLVHCFLVNWEGLDQLRKWHEMIAWSYWKIVWLFYMYRVIGLP